MLSGPRVKPLWSESAEPVRHGIPAAWTLETLAVPPPKPWHWQCTTRTPVRASFARVRVYAQVTSQACNLWIYGPATECAERLTRTREHVAYT